MTIDEMKDVMHKFSVFTTLTVANLVTFYKKLGQTRVIDGFNALRSTSYWPFIQMNCYCGKGDEEDKVSIFKMFEIGPAFRVDLVKWMQLHNDLQDSWIIFDHVKRVKK